MLLEEVSQASVVIVNPGRFMGRDAWGGMFLAKKQLKHRRIAERQLLI